MLDSKHKISRAHPFDGLFEGDWAEEGIEAYPVDGHTPGFTMYLFKDCLFICDYVFVNGKRMVYNPFGPPGDTIEGGRRIRKRLEGRDLKWVCGYKDVMPYAEWFEMFNLGPSFGGH